MTTQHSTAQERYEFIASQHGGYWRHDFIDHNYLYNIASRTQPENLHLVEALCDVIGREGK
jgi:threonine-phosphate decarboxylase